jgi:hypothetical protein
MDELKIPTNDLINEYIVKFNNDERYYLADQAIIKLFSAFPKNENLEDIILKISVINDLYSTNIFSTFKLAKHIRQLQIDNYLSEKKLSIVNEIAIGHGISKPKGQGDRNFYSFATKYCNWHKPEVYPIYDRFVHKILIEYRKTDNFSDFNDDDLKIFEKFVKIITDFKQTYSLTNWNLKEIDKFLWIYGKEKFPNNY